MKGGGMYLGLAGEQGGLLANACRDPKPRCCVISFTSDWLYPTAENRAIVHALNAAGANVSFVEIATDKGHDAFLLEEKEFFATLGGFLTACAEPRGLPCSTTPEPPRQFNPHRH